MKGILKSSNFIRTATNQREYVETSFSNVSRIYRIDDCDVTVEAQRPDIAERSKILSDFYTAKGFNKIVENYESILGSDVPILTVEEYLRELKDIAMRGDELNLSTLNRWVVETIPGVTVANVIVTGKPSDGYFTLINEVFVNGSYVKTVEYDLEQLFESYVKQFSLEPYTATKG